MCPFLSYGPSLFQILSILEVINFQDPSKYSSFRPLTQNNNKMCHIQTLTQHTTAVPLCSVLCYCVLFVLLVRTKAIIDVMYKIPFVLILTE